MNIYWAEPMLKEHKNEKDIYFSHKIETKLSNG